jgi:LacI family transcriptional regulator
MTVSRVFRNSPRVSPDTRDRVLTVAETLNYRPDPQVARLMELVRSHRVRQIASRLAVIRDQVTESPPQGDVYNYVALSDIRKRALQHGYEVEEFHLGRDGLSPQRLHEILAARSIGGVLISVQSSRQLSAQFDFTGLAAATFGYGLSTPRLHRASTNMTQGILETTALLEKRGHSRIGLAISPWVDARADHTYSGAWLHYQQSVPAKRRVPLLLFPGNALEQGESLFRTWMQKHRPDALISFHSLVPQWLKTGLGMRIPQDVAFVIHDWAPGMTGYAGIDHRRAHVAVAGVDLVATQLQHNEHGIPEVPRQILIPPAFVDSTLA